MSLFTIRKILLIFQLCVLMLCLFANATLGEEVRDLFILERYRLSEVERKLDNINTEHQRLAYLLIANLVGVVTTLILTRKKPSKGD